MLNKYIKSEGKIFEVIGFDCEGRPVCSLTTFKEIPVDKPLPKPETETVEEAKPKRGRKKQL